METLGIEDYDRLKETHRAWLEDCFYLIRTSIIKELNPNDSNVDVDIGEQMICLNDRSTADLLQEFLQAQPGTYAL